VTSSKQDESDVGSAEETEQGVVGLAGANGEDDGDDEPRPDEEGDGLREVLPRDHGHLVAISSQDTRAGDEDS